MHPFICNQISKIRSVCIISYPFHMRGLPAEPNIGATIGVLFFFVKLFLQLRLPFFLSSSLSSSHSNTVCFPTKHECRICQKLLFLVPLFILSVHHYFCLCVCVFPFLCFLIHSYPMLQSWRGMNPQLANSISQRTNSKEKNQSSKMCHSKKATRD